MLEAIYTVAIPSGCAICTWIQSFFPILGDSKWIMFLSWFSHAFRSISHSFYEEVCLKCQTKISCLTERSMRSWSDELPPRMFTHFRPLLVRPYCYCRLRECETWNHVETNHYTRLVPFSAFWEFVTMDFSSRRRITILDAHVFAPTVLERLSVTIENLRTTSIFSNRS